MKERWALLLTMVATVLVCSGDESAGSQDKSLGRCEVTGSCQVLGGNVLPHALRGFVEISSERICLLQVGFRPLGTQSTLLKRTSLQIPRQWISAGRCWLAGAGAGAAWVVPERRRQEPRDRDVRSIWCTANTPPSGTEPHIPENHAHRIGQCRGFWPGSQQHVR
jgi:hypothetical protein